MAIHSNLEPKKKYKFRIVIDGFVRAGFMECSQVGQEIDNIEYREGDDQNAPFNFRGLAKTTPLTLKRGITNDLSMHQWASETYDASQGFGRQIYKRNLQIEQLNEDNSLAQVYKLRGAYCRTYKAGDWNSTSNEVAIEEMEVVYDGFDLS